MKILSEILSNYINIVSDTYTLMAGFVAIGIPLSLQIAGQASEKYDNATLTKHYSAGNFISPRIIITLSMLYIASSISLKLISNKNDVDSIAVSELLVVSSVILFILVMISSTIFYLNLYLGLLKTTAQQIPRLLKPRPRGLFKVIKCNCLKRSTKKGRMNTLPPRYTDNDYAIVSAGLEVLISKVKTNAWGESYKSIISTMHTNIIRAYFGRYGDNVLPPQLSDVDIRFLKLYWESLLIIIRHAGESGNAELSFKTQRYLFSILGNVIHHPQSSFIISNDSYNDHGKIYFSKDLYEMARWQFHYKYGISELFLNCEWLSGINSIFSHPDIRFSWHGSLSAFQCLNSIWELLAKDSPDKILSAYKNVTDNLPSFHGDDFWFYTYSPFYNPEHRWAQEFFRDFYNSQFTLSDGEMIDKKLNELINDEAIKKYGQPDVSIPLSADQYKEIIEKINFEELYKKAFLFDSEFYSLKILAMLCLFDRKKEIENCIKWRQPADAQAHYIGDGFFPENTETLIRYISNQYHRIRSHSWFHERHDLEVHVYRASLMLLHIFYERAPKTIEINEIMPSRSMFSNTEQARGIISGLKKQVDLIDFINGALKRKMKCSFMKILKEIDKEEENIIKNSIIDMVIADKYRHQLIYGWNATNFSILNLFSLMHSNKIQNLTKNLFSCALKKEYFLGDSTSLDDYLINCGKKTHMNFINVIYDYLIKSAITISSDEMENLDGMLMFAPTDRLQHNEFIYDNSNRIWCHRTFNNCWGIESYGENILVVDPKKVSISLSKNCVDKSPLFISYHETQTNKVTLDVDIYYDISIDNKACFLLNQ
ncbi:hypothetical protein FT669_05570 [Aeromonas jandaei]|nr:hypothetical protein FT669_05570 [Aeromonas jandaei]